MKKRNIITGLVLTMVLGVGATAYAATNESLNTQCQRLGLGKITSMRGYDYMKNILKSNTGMTDAEVSNALSIGKTPYELAIEKGVSQDEFKSSLLKEKTKAIDDAIDKGTITKDEGERLKANLNSNMQNCTGNFGQGRGMIGKGQGRGCVAVPGN